MWQNIISCKIPFDFFFPPCYTEDVTENLFHDRGDRLPNGDVFKRGTVELAVLAVLQKEDMYGYQIVQEIGARSEGCFTLPLGTLYPVLYRFVEGGLISDRDEIVGKRLRKYYHLEPRGEAYYRELLSEYRTVVCGIDLITKGSEHDGA